MKMLPAFLCLCLVAGSAFADPYSAAMQQARNVSARVSNQNRQLDDNAAPAAPQNNAAADPALQATLQNIQSLRVDFASITAVTNGSLTDLQRQSLTNDLATAAQGTRAAPADVDKLADDLTSAMSGNRKLRPQEQKLAQYVHAVFNTAHLTPAQEQMIYTDTQRTLVNSGVLPEDATNLVSDIKAVADETR
jgi:hypothetical protein